MLNSTRLLVVDDEQSILEVFDSLLSEQPRWRYDCVTCADDALAEFRPGKYDVVILDKNLPGLSGVDLAQAIRQLDPDVSMVMLTGYGTVDSALHMLELGASNYIEKPPDFRQMLAILEVAVAQCADRRRVRAAGEPASTAHRDGRPLSISVVCPDNVRRDWLSDHLDGYQVEPHPSGAHALAALDSGLPDLVLIDFGGDSAAAQAFVHELTSLVVGLCCVVVLERLSLAVVKDLIEHGVVGVVGAPVTPEYLRAKLSLLLSAEG